MLDSKVHLDSAIASLSIQLGTDASKFDLDGPLCRMIFPRVMPRRAGANGRSAWPNSENLTVRELAQRMGGYSGLATGRDGGNHRR